MKGLRLGLLTTFFPEIRGGAEVALGVLLDELRRADLAVEVFTLGKSGPTSGPVVRLDGAGAIPRKVKLVQPPGFDAFVARAVRRALVARRVDVLHAYDTYVMRGAALAVRNSNIPVVLTWHNNVGIPHRNFGVPRPVGAWLDAREAATIRAVPEGARVIAISRYIEDQLVAAGVAHHRVETIYVDGAISEVVDSRPASDDATFRVVAAGRLHEHKGLQTVALAARELVRSGKPFEVVIAGDGPYRETLERLVDDASLSRYVRFTGALKPAELLRLYDAAHVAVVPSLTPEPFGRVAVEAMSRATPVVASDIGGLSEIVAHGETGFLVRPGDVDGLARRLRDLQEERNLVASMGDAAAARCRERFASTAVVGAVLDLYRDVARDARR